MNKILTFLGLLLCFGVSAQSEGSERAYLSKQGIWGTSLDVEETLISVRFIEAEEGLYLVIQNWAMQDECFNELDEEEYFLSIGMMPKGLDAGKKIVFRVKECISLDAIFYFDFIR
jgi:hypothetical protein